MFDDFGMSRPLVFIDSECTGLNPYSDRIVELTLLKVLPGGAQDLRTRRINPEMPIPAAASAIHHIHDEDVKDEPTFKQYAKNLLEYLEDCDLAGFGINRFDLPILEAEFRRCGMVFSRQGRYVIDVMTIFHRLEPRDLAAAYRRYCGKELESAHKSEADVLAAFQVLQGQLSRHPELPKDIARLHSFCHPGESEWVDSGGKFVWCDGEAVLSFGRYQGRPLKEIAVVDPSYLRWVASSDFPEDTRTIARDAAEGRLPMPEQS